MMFLRLHPTHTSFDMILTLLSFVFFLNSARMGTSACSVMLTRTSPVATVMPRMVLITAFPSFTVTTKSEIDLRYCEKQRKFCVVYH